MKGDKCMYKKTNGEIALLIAVLITALVLNLSIVALTAWVFHLTGSAWSFAILLFLFTASGKST